MSHPDLHAVLPATQICAAPEARWSSLSGNAAERQRLGRSGADAPLVWLLAATTLCGFALIGTILFSVVHVALA